MNPTRKTLETGLETQLQGALAALQTLPGLLPALADAAELLLTTLRAGGAVLTAGNGGSAAEAMHMAEELSGRYKADRPSLPGLALTADGTALTCIANDFGYDEVFARQIEGLGRPGDLLVLFSSSGKAPNLSRALRKAHARGLRVLALLGRDGGPLAGLADVEVTVPVQETEHVQEAHQVILHLLLGAVEQAFAEPATPQCPQEDCLR